MKALNYNEKIQGSQVNANSEMTTEKTEEKISNTENYTLMSWGLLALLYFFWAWIDSQDTIQESVKPSNLKINFRTMAVTTLAVIIMLNLIKIALTKIASSKIPMFNTIAKNLLTLVI